uniref:Putative secreted protein n=1 Tax=Ixodes ricinus TaxID=34613 RepID=V5GYN2_IXORI
MRSSFIFCLLAMYYIASANATFCWNISGVPCSIFCHDHYGGSELRLKDPGTPCKMPGGRDGKCENGECKKKNKVKIHRDFSEDHRATLHKGHNVEVTL